ncbi:MAG: hypothetical protein V1662_00595, partial [Candidatus Omnitrophota bacterium]
WGKYSGMGYDNDMAADWTNYIAITASSDPQVINNGGAGVWSVAGGAGAKTIYIRVRDAAGNIKGG